VAVTMASTDLAQMRKGRMDSSGEGSTNGGRICGFIGIGLGVLNMILGIVLFATGALGR
jgi:hypothetical protein